MGFRFRQSFKILPGLRLNVGKGSVSLSSGIRGLSLTLGSKGLHGNIGAPGTGVSYRSKLGGSSKSSQSSPRSSDSSSQSPTSSLPKRSVDIILKDDGTTEFRNESGERLSQYEIKEFRESYDDLLEKWLIEECEKFNRSIHAILNIHLETHHPNKEIKYIPQSFDVEKPSKPKPRNIGFLDKFMSSRLKQIEKEQAEADQIYQKDLEEWEQAKASFDQKQEETRDLINNKRFHDIESMQQFLKDSLTSIEWPYETSVNFEIENNGKIAYVDVDLPEIEMMPNKEATVASRGFRLNIKTFSDAQCRRNYLTHIHGIGFRLVGEVFTALPSIDLITLSAYSQRPEKATGQIKDDYLYSMKVSRELWSKIDFANLEKLEVAEALGRFEIRREMTKAGIITPIEPFEVVKP